MVAEVKLGPMAPSTPATTPVGKSKEPDSSSGQTTHPTRANSTKTILKGRVSTCGTMGGDSMDSGRKIKCTGTGSSLGKMEGSMRGSISSIRSTEWASLAGLMGGTTMGSGAMGNSTGRECTIARLGRGLKGIGIMERELTDINCKFFIIKRFKKARLGNNQTTEPALAAILGHSSAHSLAIGPVTIEPFISPLGLTMTPALSSKYR